MLIFQFLPIFGKKSDFRLTFSYILEMKKQYRQFLGRNKKKSKKKTKRKTKNLFENIRLFCSTDIIYMKAPDYGNGGRNTIHLSKGG